ncbi:hypothetical protein BH23THE1_BH23THE1_36270 [soil metagenome]
MNLLYSCLLIIVLLSAKNVVVTPAIAHNFSTDDNSTFLTLINMILIENRLINQSLNDNSANTSLHSDYIENINEIIDDILISEDSLLIDSDQFYNNTIIATMMANLGDEVLRKYGHAFGIPSNIIINMNFSAVDDLEKTIGKESNSDIHSNHIAPGIENYSSNLKDKSQYYGALETSKRMLEIYESDLDSAGTSLPQNSSVSFLKNSLAELNENIYNYSNPSKIMEIVHGKVHPSLQLAFNLTFKR